MALAAVFVVALAGSANTLQNSFTNWDDPVLILNNPQIRSLSPSAIVTLFTSVANHAYLPVRDLSYALDYALWGLDPYGFHLTNLLLHCANSLLLFALLARLFEDDRLALAAALIFAVHPVHSEAVAWASGRKDLLAFAFGLLTVLSFDWGDRARKRTLGIALSALCAFLACLSKPTAVVLPFLLWVALLLRKEGGARVSACVRSTLPVLLVCGAMAVAHFAIAFSKGVIKTGERETIQAWSAVASLVRRAAPLASAVEALRLLWFPANLSPFYLMQGGWIQPSAPILAVIALLATAGIIVWAVRGKTKIAAFGLFWIAIAYLPTSSVLPTSLPLAERYLYLPSLGLCVCLGAALAGLRRGAWPLAAALVLVYGLGSWSNNARWQDSLSLWRSACRTLPASSEVWNDMAAAYSQAGMASRAEGALVISARLEPPNARLRLNQGLVLMKKGNYAGAAQALREASADARYAYDARYRLAQVYEALGRIPDAVAEYKAAAAINPRAAAPHNNLGVLHEQATALAAARAAYEKAIALDPHYALAYYNLGNLEQAEKKFAEAERHYRRAIALDPAHAMAHNNLAFVLLKLGDAESAREHLLRAAELDPALLQPLLSLAIFAQAEGRKAAALEYARRALRLDPSNEAAQSMMRELQK